MRRLKEVPDQLGWNGARLSKKRLRLGLNALKRFERFGRQKNPGVHEFDVTFRRKGPGSDAAETTIGLPKKRRRLDLDALEMFRVSSGRFRRVQRRTTPHGTQVLTLCFLAVERANRKPIGVFERVRRDPLFSRVLRPGVRPRQRLDRTTSESHDSMSVREGATLRFGAFRPTQSSTGTALPSFAASFFAGTLVHHVWTIESTLIDGKPSTNTDSPKKSEGTARALDVLPARRAFPDAPGRLFELDRRSGRVWRRSECKTRQSHPLRCLSPTCRRTVPSDLGAPSAPCLHCLEPSSSRLPDDFR